MPHNRVDTVLDTWLTNTTLLAEFVTSTFEYKIAEATVFLIGDELGNNFVDELGNEWVW